MSTNHSGLSESAREELANMIGTWSQSDDDSSREALLRIADAVIAAYSAHLARTPLEGTSGLTRYDCVEDGLMFPCSDGEYVEFSTVKTILASLQERIATLLTEISEADSFAKHQGERIATSEAKHEAVIARYNVACEENERLEGKLAALTGDLAMSQRIGEHNIEVIERYGAQIAALTAERDALTAKLNTPEIADFASGVVLEAAHQRERWEDGGKRDFDWHAVASYLAAKALLNPPQNDGTTGEPPRLHRIVALGALAANWHAAVSGRTPPVPEDTKHG